MNRLIAKSLLIWVSMIPLAIANGALRELVLIPLIGPAGFPVSGVLLCALLYMIVSIFLPRLGTGQKGTYVKMGVIWVVCTVVFETLLGLLNGDSLCAILSNYNFLTGNLWLFVVVFFGFAPWLVAKRKGMIQTDIPTQL